MTANRWPDGPPQTGVLGSLQTAYRFATDAVGLVHERFERYGDIYYVRGKPDLYVLRHPEHLHRVLVEKPSAFSKEHGALERLSRVLGGGLLTSDGSAWRRHRRMIQPAFQRAQLVQYCDAMREEAEALADRWQDGQTVDMGQEMMALTLAIVCRTLFSHDASGETGSVAQAMATLQDQVTRPDLLPEWFPAPGRRRLARATKTLDDIVLGMIRERRDRVGQFDDLLDRLLLARDEDGSALSEQEIRDELVTLFLAGHETTAQALTWTWYLLSGHRSAEQTLHAELDAIDGPIGYPQLESLGYAEQVIDEAMRLYPPVYVIARRAAETVDVGGYSIPAGSELILWVYWTHHDPRWYENPFTFRPERFSPDARARLPKSAYLPFGAGPRTCIGKIFALFEARILLATLARQFRAELAPGQQVDIRMRVTLTPKDGMKMILRRR